MTKVIVEGFNSHGVRLGNKNFKFEIPDQLDEERKAYTYYQQIVYIADCMKHEDYFTTNDKKYLGTIYTNELIIYDHNNIALKELCTDGFEGVYYIYITKDNIVYIEKAFSDRFYIK